MEPNRWAQIKSIFYKAAKQPADQRAAFIRSECSGDESLALEIESLFDAREQSGSNIEALHDDKTTVSLEGEAVESQPALVGRRIGHYQMLSALGAGGMGEVYLAEDTKLSRRVAIKCLPKELTANEQAKRRFLREARAAATLDHPNICAIHEVGEENDHSFIVMQYIEGENLADRIRRQPLELSESLSIAVQVSEAISEAHSRRIIHRDIKPQNVMITARGQVKVVDFGLSKVIPDSLSQESAAETQSLLSERGLIVGTIPYMSPEQVKGEELDARTDVFSFGALLYEMVSGRQPFQSESSATTISAILMKEPPPLARFSPDVPSELERIVAKALRKDREERYQGIKDLALDLKNLKEQLEFEAKLERSQPSVATLKGAGIPTVSNQPMTHSELTGPGEPCGSKAEPRADGEEVERLAGQAVFVAKKKRKAGLVAALAFATAVSLAVAGFYLWSDRTAPGLESKSIAVLPFKPLTAENRDEALEFGMADALITKLSNIKQIVVRPTSAILKYRDLELDLPAIGREQKVDLLMEGKVQRSGDSVRVTVQLVRASDAVPLWAGKFDERFTNIFSVQDSISQQVAATVVSKLSGEQKQQLAKNYTDNIEAYNLYLNGRFFWNKFSDEGLKKAIEYFKQAIVLDPDYALAYTGLSNAYMVQGAYGLVPPNELWTEARQTAQRAVDLDDSLTEAHQTLGAVKLLYEWDWAAAEKELKRAIELNPNHTDAHSLYGYYFWVVAELDKAFSEIKRAQELSPISPIVNLDFSTALYYRGNYDEAISAYRKVQELDPNMLNPVFITGQSYERNREYGRAVEECQGALSTFGRDPGVLSALAYVYGVSGSRDKALEIINELEAIWKTRYFSPLVIALAYTGVGDKDGAFVWLTKAYESRDPQLIWLRAEPQLESLRSDQRFQSLLRRMGIPQ